MKAGFAVDAQVLASTPRSELMEDEPPAPTPVGANRGAGRVPPAGLRRLPWVSEVGFAGPESWAEFRPFQVLPGADSGPLCFVLGLIREGVEAS